MEFAGRLRYVYHCHKLNRYVCISKLNYLSDDVCLEIALKTKDFHFGLP